MTLAVIGATGRSGVALVRALARRGIDFIPVARSAAKWACFLISIFIFKVCSNLIFYFYIIECLNTI